MGGKYVILESCIFLTWISVGTSIQESCIGQGQLLGLATPPSIGNVARFGARISWESILLKSQYKMEYRRNNWCCCNNLASFHSKQGESSRRVFFWPYRREHTSGVSERTGMLCMCLHFFFSAFLIQDWCCSRQDPPCSSRSDRERRQWPSTDQRNLSLDHRSLSSTSGPARSNPLGSNHWRMWTRSQRSRHKWWKFVSLQLKPGIRECLYI